MEKKVQEILSAEFPPEKIKTRKGAGGMELSYIETHECIKRLNAAFDGDWDFVVVNSFTEGNEILVHGRLLARNRTKEQFGSHVFRGKNAGDAYKSAASDALKKCASLFGVGLHLYEGTGPKRTHSGPKGGGPASEKQIAFARNLIGSRNGSVNEEEKKLGCPLEKMTKAQASEIIERLNK